MDIEGFEPVIGLEVHAQLLTASKMYCACQNDYAAAPPNTRVCPVCLGLPGALPVINAAAVELTAMTGLALHCDVGGFTRFDRKNYFYPDLMKGYQISQYQFPIAREGWLEFEVSDQSRRVGIRRVHLEEDTAKLSHRVDQATGRSYSLVDVNRGGVPLMEIVGDPDIRSAEEARLYLVQLRTVLQFLGVSTGNMEEGSFRCDANVSIRPVGSDAFGTKVEIKNMNSFRAVYRALEHEVLRQIEARSAGVSIVQETRGWDDVRGITVSQRSKEFAHDYRYFPEPDLPPLTLSAAWVEQVRAKLPELPDRRRLRFIEQYSLSPYDAELLTGSCATADYFETAVAALPQPKLIANWMTGELFRLLNAENLDLGQSKVTPTGLAELVKLIDSGIISTRAAKDVFDDMFRTGQSAAAIVAAKGLSQISDTAAIEQLIQSTISASPQSVADYRAGKKQALGFLVGQVMKASRGKANPGLVSQMLQAALDNPR